jgi:hypothetical protein
MLAQGRGQSRPQGAQRNTSEGGEIIMQQFIISWFIRKYGAKKFIEDLIETYIPAYHLQRFPKRKISKEVMADRVQI